MSQQPYNHNLDPTYRLVYQARPEDMLTWSRQYPFGNTATFNQELETYMPANVYQYAGNLVLEGRNTGGGNMSVGTGAEAGKYTSGMVASYNTISFLYGYFEACIKFPAGFGVWPAFWMLYSTYPAINEIDICEIFENPTSLNSGVHFPGGATHDGGPTTVVDMSQGYHYYAVDWEPTYVQFYFDGMPTIRITASGEIPSQLMYILMNVAISGVAVNDDVPSDAQFPIQMHVQYVKVWQRTTTQYQFVTTSTPNYANYTTAVMLDGASNAYKMGETTGVLAHDTIGGANGTITGGITLNQTALLGDLSPSMLFDGSTGYIALPTSVKPDGLYAFTAEVWFAYPTSHAGGRILSNAHTDQTNTGFQMAVDGTSGGLVSLATTNKTSNIYWGTTYTIGKTYHYVFTYDGAHIYVYCNGVQVGNDTLTGAIVSSGLPINIGRGSYVIPNDYFGGLVSHVELYPIALTANQVAAHYSAGIATLNGPATLVLSDTATAVVTATDKVVA